MVLFIIISILVLLVIFGVIAIMVLKRGRKKPTDYYNFFIIGIIWLPFGIFMSFVYEDGFIGNFFSILGLIYIILGLAHKKEWKNTHKSWGQLSKTEQKWKVIIFIILGFLVLAGLIAFYIVKSRVTG
tara:strand:- start:2675 stop:3058 length:384 start_codon:yes stop_codon:yes gene_type:complete